MTSAVYSSLLILGIALPLHMQPAPTPASAGLPFPWLTKTQASALRITCQLNVSLWNSVDGLELKFLPRDTLRNVTMLSVTSVPSLKRGHIHPWASVKLLHTRDILSGLTVIMPYSQADLGTYFVEANYTSRQSNVSGTISQSLDVDWNVDEERFKTAGVLDVWSYVTDQVNITWVPPPGSELEQLSVVRHKPFVTDENLYKMSRENTSVVPSLSDNVLLAKYLMPGRTSCGGQNHTLALFIRDAKICSMMISMRKCTYTCEVWYPECNDGHSSNDCKWSGDAMPPGDLETDVSTVPCSEEPPARDPVSTATESTTQGPGHAPTTGEPGTPQASEEDVNASPITLVSVSPTSFESVLPTTPAPLPLGNLGECTGECVAFRAAAITCSVLLVVVFVACGAILLYKRRRQWLNRHGRDRTRDPSCCSCSTALILNGRVPEETFPPTVSYERQSNGSTNFERPNT
ncbi:hypothetical protein BaRGS_00008263 [Batillaria attramentaria]|uniref:Uncharacterized protein n=1 Tax=Batillaria attramentaria TaxID=370345 RepID=A0ABD0LM84_9CAEN